MLLEEVRPTESLADSHLIAYEALQGAHSSLPTQLNTKYLKSFSLPPTGPRAQQSLKRQRSLDSQDCEVDGLNPRKKRRLRLGLVTSRLSEPYATPPTFIPVRRGVRTGVWARQRITGRNLLRKAAIFNIIAMKRKGCGSRGVDLQHPVHKASLLGLVIIDLL